MKEYIVYFGSRIAGSYDYTIIMAENEMDALNMGKPMLNTHKLYPDYLNNFGCFGVRETK